MTDVKTGQAVDSDVAKPMEKGGDVTMSDEERGAAGSEEKPVMKDSDCSGPPASPPNKSSAATLADTHMAGAPFARANDTKTDDLPKSFSKSGPAFQAALLEEIKEIYVVKMDALVSQQPWLATFRLAGKGISHWETALATDMQKYEFSSFVDGAGEDFRYAYGNLLKEISECENSPLALNLLTWLHDYAVPYQIDRTLPSLRPSSLTTLLSSEERKGSLHAIFNQVVYASMRSSLLKAKTFSASTELSQYGSRSLVSGSLVSWRTLQQIAINAEAIKARRATTKGNGSLQETTRQYRNVVKDYMKLSSEEGDKSLWRITDNYNTQKGARISKEVWVAIEDEQGRRELFLDDGIIQLLYEVKQLDHRSDMDRLTLHDGLYTKQLPVATRLALLRELYIRLQIAHDSWNAIHRAALLQPSHFFTLATALEWKVVQTIEHKPRTARGDGGDYLWEAQKIRQPLIDYPAETLKEPAQDHCGNEISLGVDMRESIPHGSNSSVPDAIDHGDLPWEGDWDKSPCYRHPRHRNADEAKWEMEDGMRGPFIKEDEEEE